MDRKIGTKQKGSKYLVLFREAVKKQARKALWGEVMRISKLSMFCLFEESRNHDLLLVDLEGKG